MNSVFHHISKVLARNTPHGLELTSKGKYLFSTKFIPSNDLLRNNKLITSSLCSACSGRLKAAFLVRCKSTSSAKVKIKMNESQLTDEYGVLQKEAQHNVTVADGWLTVGQYNVFAWSVSGTETCIVVKAEDVLVAFDLGAAISESVRVKDVFITHGHLDHIGAVSSHVSKRSLFGMKPGRYFVPPHLVDHLLAVTRAHYHMAETVEALANVNVLPFAQGDTVRLNSQYFVRSFPTVHRVPSQGYIVYREQKKLKEEYKGRPGFEIAALHREGKEIHDICVTPEFAYTGDTTFDVFSNPPTPDLFKVKLLITEATFLDDEIGKQTVKKARDRGHCHLSEFTDNAELFTDVGHIILMHFSNKYSPKFITEILMKNLPTSLKYKVSPAVVAKATKPTTVWSSKFT